MSLFEETGILYVHIISLVGLSEITVFCCHVYPMTIRKVTGAEFISIFNTYLVLMQFLPSNHPELSKWNFQCRHRMKIQNLKKNSSVCGKNKKKYYRNIMCIYEKDYLLTGSVSRILWQCLRSPVSWFLNSISNIFFLFVSSTTSFLWDYSHFIFSFLPNI